MTSSERPRINLSPDPELMMDLEDWAQQQRRPIASMALYLLARIIEESRRTGEFVPTSRGEDISFTHDEVEQIQAYIKLIIGEREERDGISFQEVGELLGLEPESLKRHYEFVLNCRNHELKEN